MPLLPLHQEQLGHHQRGNQDQDHLGVHGLVAAVLGMHASMLHPEREQWGWWLQPHAACLVRGYLAGTSSLSAVPVEPGLDASCAGARMALGPGNVAQLPELLGLKKGFWTFQLQRQGGTQEANAQGRCTTQFMLRNMLMFLGTQEGHAAESKVGCTLATFNPVISFNPFLAAATSATPFSGCERPGQSRTSTTPCKLLQMRLLKAFEKLFCSISSSKTKTALVHVCLDY